MRDIKKQKQKKTPDLTRGGNSNDIAQGPIVEVYGSGIEIAIFRRQQIL